MVHNAPECDNAEMYALGGLSEEESKAFERHLAGCEACALQVAELKAIVDLLPLSVEPVQTPAGMQDRILGHILGDSAVSNTSNQDADAASDVTAKLTPADSAADAFRESTRASDLPPMNEPGPRLQADVGQTRKSQSEPELGREPQPRQPLPAEWPKAKPRRWSVWVSAALAAAVIVLGIYVFSLRDQLSDLRGQLTATTEPPQGLRPNEAVNLSAAAKDIVANGLATIVIDSKGTHLLVQAEKLPQLKGNEAFQVWLMKDGSGVVNAGTFVSRDGKGGLYLTLDRNLSGYNQIAITQEPDAFGQLPRGTAVLSAEISL
ncbi:anti-sigma factor [Paenibacillus sacheonensis]|uniref:Anti-sigma-W factor RsiW n=1 Tax=Paenibacillus sacheonensis TaxID=742054 RepID=A0A7X4YRK7_9BACL|nr:anti-sigma factor [Paenibacillus sacheonensis]MBM7567642.1 anti-sigma factor RsiW [Paenibacillus sacheonensis]NBC71255.1 hypothetical protein [Paenibacillus sacheonensis]